MSSYGSLITPVGSLGVTSTGDAITGVAWRSTRPADAEDRPDPLLTEALTQLAAYFTGALRRFDLPLDLSLQPDSTRAVLTTLSEKVGYGDAVTYGELAARNESGVPARGIGAIMGANPLPIVIPCHRVLASDGLGGYSGGTAGQGLAVKRWLLELEGVLPTSLF